MGSMIYILEEGNPQMRKVAEYSTSPKEALVAYVEQFVFENFNTWEYPEKIEGMRESSTLADHWYFDLWKSKGYKRNSVIAAYPMDTPLSA